MLEWDDRKRRTNLEKHGVDFAAFEGFEWDTCLALVDTRWDYGEVRMRLIGLIGERLHVAVATRRGETLRLISLRKANAREGLIWARSR